MKTIYLILLLSLSACCAEKKDEKIRYYWVSQSHHGRLDTLPLQNSSPHPLNRLDSLVGSAQFRIRETGHALHMYSNFDRGGEDVGHILFVLDDIGVIYGKSTTWFAYGKLTSNNDSINELLDMAMNQIVFKFLKFDSSTYNLDSSN